MKRHSLTLAPNRHLRLSSLPTTPSSSAYPSSHSSDDEDDLSSVEDQSFRFLDLPSELRTKIYDLLFVDTPPVLDLDNDIFRKVRRVTNIFAVCRQIHDESCHRFYSTHTVRLFPCNDDGRYFRAKVPLFGRLKAHCRASSSSFELRLGPGFAAPPRGWVVNDALGLKDATNVRFLKVMVQIDPSQPIFQGFRRGDEGFYENFSKALMEKVLLSVPSITDVQFDAWSSVKKNGPMISALRSVAKKHNKRISWGPERGWAHSNDEEEDDGWPSTAALAKSLAEIATFA